MKGKGHREEEPRAIVNFGLTSFEHLRHTDISFSLQKKQEVEFFFSRRNRSLSGEGNKGRKRGRVTLLRPWGHCRTKEKEWEAAVRSVISGDISKVEQPMIWLSEPSKRKNEVICDQKRETDGKKMGYLIKLTERFCSKRR